MIQNGMTKLRAWRTANGITLDELAGLLGISESLLSRVERGERRLSPLDTIRVSRLIGVPVRDLIPQVEASATK